MAIMASKLYTALRQANVSEENAIAATEEVASMESLARIEAKLDKLSDDITNKLGTVETKLDTFSNNLIPRVAALEARSNEISLRIAALPTTVQLITLVFGILTGAFLIVRFAGHH